MVTTSVYTVVEVTGRGSIVGEVASSASGLVVRLHCGVDFSGDLELSLHAVDTVCTALSYEVYT